MFDEKMVANLDRKSASDEFWKEVHGWKVAHRGKVRKCFESDPRGEQECRESFWRKVKKEAGCWRWKGPRGLDGKVGTFMVKMGGKRVFMTAHRYSWIQKHGEIPDDAVVRPSCGNGLCVNPEHLMLMKVSHE